MCKNLTILLVSLLGISSAFGYEYKKHYLSDYQNGSLILGCHDSQRAGTLFLDRQYNYPSRSFSVNVTLHPDCPTHYRLYINIKQLNLNDFDVVYINESGRIAKTLPGGRHSPNTNPTSVAQFFSSTVSVVIQYVKGYYNQSPYSNPLVLEFSWANTDSGSGESLCLAFPGYDYLLPELMCESGDRVNCPLTYYADSGINNAVYFTNQDHCDIYGLGLWELIGIAFGVLLFIALVGGAVCRRHHHRQFRHETLVTHVEPDCVHSTNSYGTINYAGPEQHVAPAYPTFAPAPPPPYTACVDTHCNDKP